MEKTQTTSLQTMRPAERRVVAVVALIAMLRMFGLFALLPVLAIYVADMAGATPLLIGLAVGGYGLTQAAFQVPFGSLSDRLGRRPVILLGLALFLAGSLLAGLSETIYGVVGGRFLQGAGAVSATLTALLGDATRPEVRTRSMAFLGIGIGLSFLLAIIFGPVIAAAAGVRSLFWAAAVAAIVAALLVTRLPGRDVSPVAIVSRSFKGAITPALLRIDSYVFLLHALLTAMFVGMPFLLLNQIGLPIDTHWKVYVYGLLASLLLTVPLIVADDRQGRPALLAIAITLIMCGLLVLALAPPSFLLAVVALGAFFGGFNFLEAGLPARASLLAGEQVRGAAMGVFSSSQFLGAFAGGMLGGLLYDNGSSDVFLVCAALAGGWLVWQLLSKQSA